MPPEDNYAEMICPACMDSLPFLNKYLGYASKFFETIYDEIASLFH